MVSDAEPGAAGLTTGGVGLIDVVIESFPDDAIEAAADDLLFVLEGVELLGPLLDHGAESGLLELLGVLGVVPACIQHDVRG